jgi:phosphate transport system substrate-binding protein
MTRRMIDVEDQRAAPREKPTREEGKRKGGRAARNVAIVVCSLVLLPSVWLLVSFIVGLSNSGAYVRGEADRSSQINVTLERSADWRRLVSEPVIAVDEFALVDGSTATVPLTAELLRQFYGYSDEEVEAAPSVNHSTTDVAYRNLIDGVVAHPPDEGSDEGYPGRGDREPPPVGLILVTPPSAEELAYAQAAGVTLEQTPVALDGFVFIVNRSNPVENLTLEQIRGIYSGAITNWREVGGLDEEIRAFQREEGSGSQTAMVEMVMRDTPMLPPPMIVALQGMGSLVDEVAAYENGASSIGYSFDYYVRNLYLNEDIKVLRVEGVEPGAPSYLDGSYPLTTAYCAVIRADEPVASPARRLRDFLLTETGQSVIEMAGYTRAVSQG